MKKTLSLLLAVLLVMGMLSALPALQASAEDTVTLRTYTNIARGKQVKTGNDSAFQSGSYATDGGYGGTGVDISWGTLSSPNANCYVIVDLGDSYTVNGVKVANYADTGRYYYWDAYASNDMSTWTLIAQKLTSAPSISGGYYFETEVTEARYIKIAGTYHSANSGYHFVEVEVYSPDVYTDGDTVAAQYAGAGYTATLTADGTLTVSGSGAVGGATSSAADYPWDGVRSYIRKVVAESGVTEIGSNAFTGCANLHTLFVKGKVTFDSNPFGSTLTELFTFGEYYTDVFANARGISNKELLRRAITGAYGGVKWKTFENDSILYVYGCGALTYQNRDSIPWFQASAIRGNYEKVVVADAITDIGMYAFSADAYGKLASIVLGASVQQFKYQSMAFIPLADLTFLAPVTYFGHSITYGNKYSGTLEVTIASGQTSSDLISKQDGYPGSGTAGNDKLHAANFTNVALRHVEWVDDTTGKVVYATYVADGQTPVFAEENRYVYEGVTYEFTVPATSPVTQDETYHLTSAALIDHHVTWIREGTGAVLYEADFAHGTLPEYGGPLRLVEDGTVYIGTAPEVQPALADATYTVSFTALPKYTIRWLNGSTDETIYEAQVSETLMPEFAGTLPEAYSEGDVTYTPVLPPVHEVTAAQDYVVYFYANYDTSNYPEIYQSGINYKMLDETTLYIYGTGAIPSYESSGGSDAPWAQYRSVVTKVIVSDGITEIGSCALRDYPNLTEIVLGKDVAHFMYAAFAIDYSLEYMTFLGEITYYFGHHCFSGMSKALKVTQAAGQTHADLIYQQYGHGVAAGNDQLFNVTAENYVMVPRIVARFVDGHTGDTLFITSLASGTVPYFPVDLPAPYVENGITYTPVLPELTAITESTTYTVTYAPDHAHEWGDWTVTPATFTQAGERSRTCPFCSYTETEDIPAATLDVCDTVVVGEKDGANTATVVCSISEKDIDVECVDKLVVTLTYEKDGAEKTVSRIVRSIYSTLSDVATTSADTAAGSGLLYVEAGYIFGLRLNNVPEGAHGITVTVDAVLGTETLATVTKTVEFTV